MGVISAYPSEDWHAARIARAAAARASAEVLSPLDFEAEMALGRTRMLVRGEPASEYHAFLTPRALGDDGDAELQLELYRTLAEDGALVVNDVRALTVAIDKFKTSWLLARAGVPTPRAVVVQREAAVGTALASLGGRAVAKPLYGSLGMGVELVSSAVRAKALLERWQALYLQEYVPGGGRDVRAFVVGGRVEEAILRVAPPGEFRTNVHLGGTPERILLDEAAAALAVRAAREVGLDYAGVDLVAGPDGPVVLEVNGTPLFRGIWDATGRDMAEPIVEHVLARLRGRQRGATGVERRGRWPRRARGT